MGSYANAIAYFPNGAISGFNYGNGVARTMTQNTRGLPWVATETGFIQDTYSYDANGNVAGIADGIAGNVTSRTMAYDDLDRLTSVSAPNLWGTASYAYDGIDNILTSSFTAGSTARTSTHGYDYATNRLTGITSSNGAFAFSYGYDGQGNITQRGSQFYTFDQGNRMTAATGKATYAYDGFGHRVRTVAADGTTKISVYMPGGQLVYVSKSGGPNPASTTRFISLDHHTLAEVDSVNGVQYDHTDALGSPVAHSNASATLVDRTRYEPYGSTASGATPTAVGFTGHMSDADTGLDYMQQRYYDPVAGRFLSIDPVMTDTNTGANFNRYIYGNDNPYSYVDPNGKLSFPWHFGITYWAARDAGLGFTKSISLAWNAMAVDFRGTQGHLVIHKSAHHLFRPENTVYFQ